LHHLFNKYSKKTKTATTGDEQQQEEQIFKQLIFVKGAKSFQFLRQRGSSNNYLLYLDNSM
jgi:hypothetical protein